jgi:hypothetical protein
MTELVFVIFWFVLFASLLVFALWRITIRDEQVEALMQFKRAVVRWFVGLTVVGACVLLVASGVVRNFLR